MKCGNVYVVPIRHLYTFPGEYRWSGHAELLGLREQEFLDVGETLKTFAPTLESARQRYLESVRFYVEIRQENGLLRDLPKWKTVENDEALVDPAFGKTYHDFRDKRISRERHDPPICYHLFLSLVTQLQTGVHH